MAEIGIAALAFVLVVAVAVLADDLIIDPTNLYGVTVTSTSSGAITAKCASCTVVIKGVYYQSDANGVITTQFDCTSSAVARKFCAKPTVTSIPAIVPDALSMCAAQQLPVTCLDKDSLYVTVWGNEFLDPSYISVPNSDPLKPSYMSGSYRVVALDAYSKLYLARGSYIPRSPQAFGMWGPDMAAFSGTDVLSVLLPNNGQAYMPRANNLNNFTDRINYNSAPNFSNYNNKMLIYQGRPTYFGTRRETFGLCDSPCTYLRLYTYLTTHVEVSTRPMLASSTVNWVTSLTLVGRTDAEVATAKQNFAKAFKCDPNTCFNNVAPFFTKTFGSYWNIWFLDLLGPSGNFKYGLGAPSSNDGVIKLVTSFGSGADEAPMPFFMMCFAPIMETIYMGMYQYAIESVDGIKWTAHPDSVPKELYQYVATENWKSLFQTLYSAPITPNMCTGNNYCHVPLTNTGANRYIRIVTVVGQGANKIYNTTGNDLHDANNPYIRVVVPENILTAGDVGSVSLYVVPEMDWRLDISNHGQRQCANVPGCTVLDAGMYYQGIPALQTFFKNVVTPTLFGGCTNVVLDPVVDFLNLPAVKPTVCYKLIDQPTKKTCYKYDTSTRTSNVPALFTNSLRTQVTYTKSGYSLTITQENFGGEYPVPQAVLGGPFTPTQQQPVAFVYTTPVVGSLRYGDSYVTTTESCTFGTPLGSLAENPSCTCHPFPFTSTACLCNDYRSYKVTGSIPQGLTFTYPAFFAPVSIPTNYTVVNSRTSFDNNLFTSVTIDCPTFLCSNNYDCLTSLYRSNYMEFCTNQKLILESTLNNLQDVTSRVASTVSSFLDRNAVPPTINIVNIPPVPSSGLQSLPAVPMMQKLAAYTSTATTTATYNNAPNKVNYEGYNMANPFTTPGEAFGMSIFPWAGVGVLTAKVNTLAMQTANTLAYTNYLGSRIETLAQTAASGFTAVYNIAVDLANAHNQLVNQVNAVTMNQNNINANIAQAINQLSIQLNVAVRQINFLDLIGSRAATLGVQVSAIMVKSLDQATRGRLFAQRIAACSSTASSSAALCANSQSGKLLSVIVQQVGSVSIMDTLVMEPTTSTTVYGAPEFCYKGLHYTVYNDGYVFVIVNSTMMVTAKDLYDPRPIDSSNANVMQPCRSPVLVISDLTPGVNVVPILTAVSTSLIATVANLSALLDFKPLPLITAMANISTELTRLNQTITELTNFTVTKVTVFDNATAASTATRDYEIAVAGLGVGVFSVVVASALIIAAVAKGKSLRGVSPRGGKAPMTGSGKYYPLNQRDDEFGDDVDEYHDYDEGGEEDGDGEEDDEWDEDDLEEQEPVD